MSDIELKVRDRRELLEAPEKAYGIGFPDRQGAASAQVLALGRSMVVWVFVPTIIAAIYLFFFAADQFGAKAQFVVRGKTNPVGSEVSGTFGALIALNTSQDTYIAADLLHDDATVRDLAGQFDLRKIFTAPGLDLFAGLSADSTPQQVAKYWSETIATRVEPISGVITVEIRTFDSASAAAVVSAAIKRTEDRLNELHRNYLTEIGEIAAERVKEAAASLAVARADILKFRNDNRAIDVAADARSGFALLSDLRAQRIDVRAAISVERARGAPDSPKVRLLQRRLDALDKQIAASEAELTSKSGTKTAALSAALEVYDSLVLRESIASKFYTRALAASYEATQRLQRRDVYLDVFAAPEVAQDSEYPKRSSLLGLVFMICFGVWALVRLIRAATMEHEA